MKGGDPPECPICGDPASACLPAEISPFLRERCRLSSSHEVNSCYCNACSYVFFAPLLSCAELGLLFSGYRGSEYTEQRVRLEPAYGQIAERISDIHSSFYQTRRALYDEFRNRHDLKELVVDAGDGGGYFGRYAYPEADVVTLARLGETPGVILPELMAAADVLFIAHGLQQSPRPVAALTRFTRWMHTGSVVWLDVPIEYGGLLGASFAIEQALVSRGAGAGPMATLHENLSHYSVSALRRLCARAGLVPLEFVRDAGVLGVLARRSDVQDEPSLPTAPVAAPSAERERCAPETSPAPVRTPPPAVSSVGAVGGEEASRLLAELDRREVQLAEIYASTSWRITGWLRLLASAIRRREPATPRLTSPPSPTLELGARLDLAATEADAFLARGFSGREEWGRWTDGAMAVFRCRHATRRAPGEFEVWPHMVWSRGDGTPVTVAVSANGGKPSPVSVKAGAPFVIPLPAELMAEPQLEVKFHILDPKRPEEAPVGDGRRLGLGLQAVRLRFIDDGPAPPR